ncbi:PhoH-like phosphate starvation-inducible [Micromonas pusilla virus 12T]|jgi:phosphate starvation-inducible PhoH-like protein|uniref:PhoH-like phosphate starvation-inducible n=1 Tax=Micromonas pusilla virus 12T TaxID=755272 RepID=UPI00014C2DC2|nr:PhoH-like phosphate starvation-inducible [Micromonas pusilla virus 12T]AGH30853.1 PhoH family protein [Micromonas pusilla virus 12T]|tara:strand:+ start:7825 stop:8433 length:609 start_codon:yes stop_codon:yes gene_type:complete
MNFPKTPGQCKYMLALRSQKPIIIGTGPAGSGKTMLACQIAIENIHKYSRSRVILTRPIVAADEDMGYLPGDLFQKMEPWTKPMYDIFEKHLTHNQMDRSIVIEPLGYMRGRTFDDTIIIADEMQNSTPNQMKMLLTRVGEGTRLIVTGDMEQSDLGPENGLTDLIYKMQCVDLEYMKHIEMEDDDIVRHPAVNEVLKVLKA